MDCGSSLALLLLRAPRWSGIITFLFCICTQLQLYQFRIKKGYKIIIFARITPNVHYMSGGCQLQAPRWSGIITFLTIFTILHLAPGTQVRGWGSFYTTYDIRATLEAKCNLPRKTRFKHQFPKLETFWPTCKGICWKKDDKDQK